MSNSPASSAADPLLACTIRFMAGCRQKTDALISRVEKAADPQAALEWRPGPGRAHIGWQLVHIGATEEKFARNRLHAGELAHPDIIAAFGHGSTPDDTAWPLERIKGYLQESRAIVTAAIHELAGVDLDSKPDTMADRGWSYADALNLLVWHEGHHQGQGHITMNLFELEA